MRSSSEYKSAISVYNHICFYIVRTSNKILKMSTKFIRHRYYAIPRFCFRLRNIVTPIVFLKLMIY